MVRKSTIHDNTAVKMQIRCKTQEGKVKKLLQQSQLLSTVMQRIVGGTQSRSTVLHWNRGSVNKHCKENNYCNNHRSDKALAVKHKQCHNAPEIVHVS